MIKSSQLSTISKILPKQKLETYHKGKRKRTLKPVLSKKKLYDKIQQDKIKKFEILRSIKEEKLKALQKTVNNKNKEENKVYSNNVKKSCKSMIFFFNQRKLYEFKMQ